MFLRLLKRLFDLNVLTTYTVIQKICSTEMPETMLILKMQYEKYDVSFSCIDL